MNDKLQECIVIVNLFLYNKPKKEHNGEMDRVDIKGGKEDIQCSI